MIETLITKNGWKEIRTKYIKINKMSNTPFISVKGWITGSKNIGLYKGFRTCCSFCKTTWDSLDDRESIYVAYTNDGNKILCEECYNLLKEDTQDET